MKKKNEIDDDWEILREASKEVESWPKWVQENADLIFRDESKGETYDFDEKQFKKLWDSDEHGGGLTFEDIADCAKAWKLCDKPKCMPIQRCLNMVLIEANCELLEEELEDENDVERRRFY